MAIFAESFKESLRLHTFNTIFSCRIDIGKNEHIGIIKSSEKIFEQGLSPGVTVGLEYSNDPFPPTRSCGLQRRHNLNGMVPIIIHNEDSLLFSFDLKSPLNSAKI